jgi:2-polyprenyl-6-methoxyphenol hydroxylase-like FAD-dependent oxidoreductase
MFKKTNPDVLIAGAGPAGLIAAIALARRGVRVQIADAERETAAHSYALALHPGTLRLFDQLGLLPEVLKHCYRVDEIGMYEGAERRRRLELGKLSGNCPFLAVMPQSALETLLEKTLADLGVKIQWSHRVTRFTPEGDRVNATVDKLVTESIGYAVAHTARVVSKSTEVHPAFLIGADGHHSLVRRAMEIGFEEVGPAQNFAVFEFWSSVDLQHEMRVVFNDDDTNVLWPLPGGRCRWSFELKARGEWWFASNDGWQRPSAKIAFGSPGTRDT